MKRKIKKTSLKIRMRPSVLERSSIKQDRGQERILRGIMRPFMIKI